MTQLTKIPRLYSTIAAFCSFMQASTPLKSTHRAIFSSGRAGTRCVHSALERATAIEYQLFHYRVCPPNHGSTAWTIMDRSTATITIWPRDAQVGIFALPLLSAVRATCLFRPHSRFLRVRGEIAGRIPYLPALITK